MIHVSIHQVGSSVTWPQASESARLASATHVRGMPRGGKGTSKRMDTTCPPGPGMIDSLLAQGRSAGGAQNPIVPAARIRVRLARQVPRPIDEYLAAGPPGLIVVCYARAGFDGLYLFLLPPGQTWHDLGRTHLTSAQPATWWDPLTSLSCCLDAGIG